MEKKITMPMCTDADNYNLKLLNTNKTKKEHDSKPCALFWCSSTLSCYCFYWLYNVVWVDKTDKRLK